MIQNFLTQISKNKLDLIRLPITQHNIKLGQLVMLKPKSKIRVIGKDEICIVKDIATSTNEILVIQAEPLILHKNIIRRKWSNFDIVSVHQIALLRHTVTLKLLKNFIERRQPKSFTIGRLQLEALINKIK